MKVSGLNVTAFIVRIKGIQYHGINDISTLNINKDSDLHHT